MVFVVQLMPGKDILSASHYGEIVPLLAPDSQVTFSAGAVTQQLRSKLSNFCDDDYLLLMGDPVAIGIAVAVASDWNRGRVKMLKWDRIKNTYFPVQMCLYQKEDNHAELFA
jgi:hypothetical protein